MPRSQKPRKKLRHGQNNKRVGVVTGDKTLAPKEGDSFRFDWKRFFPPSNAGAGEIEEWDMFGTALLALSLEANGRSSFLGSAVLIGPGIALAARHIFDGNWDGLEDGSITVLATSIGKAAATIWVAHQLVVNGSDVAIVRLNLVSDVPAEGIVCASLTTRTPSIGELVMIAGMPSQCADLAKGEPVPLTVRAGVGCVSEIYLQGRDRVMLPGPCLQVDCLTVGGMSGGPVFDKHGYLIGVLTSSFEGDPPSFISLWWVSAKATIETSWPPNFLPLPTDLLAMARAGAASIERPEAIEELGGPDVQYTRWSV